MARLFALLAAGALAGVPGLAQETRPAEVDPSVQRTQPLFSARIIMEDGVAPPMQLQVRSYGGCVILHVFGNGTVTFSLPVQDISEHVYRMPSCPVAVTGPGVRSQYVTLRDGMQVLLKRLGPNEGSTISMTVLKAPPKARKAYADGAAALQKKKNAEAQKRFMEAIRIYPDYALAWSELGGLLIRMGDIDSARAALKQAIRSDKMYLKPLAQLTVLEAQQDRWSEAIQAADTALTMHPLEFPEVYVYRALAHLRAAEWKQAAELSREAIKLDTRQEFPQAYLILASALEKQGEIQASASVLEEYLSTNPSRENAARATAYVERLHRHR